MAKYYFLALLHQLFFTLLMIVSIILIIVSHKNKEFDIHLREEVIQITRPVVRIIEYPVNIFAKTILEIRDFVFAKRYNKILRKENKNLKMLHMQALNIQNENENLKEILNFLDINPIFKYRTAKIYYTSRNSIVDKIIIKSGKKDGLVENSLILGDEGAVIGRIVNVGENISDVLLLTDVNSKIPVVILGEQRVKGILAGNGSDKPNIMYLEKDREVQKGNLVFTSGDNDLIVSGLLIGKISVAEEDKVEVKLLQNIKKIDNVLIVDVDQDFSRKNKINYKEE